MNIQEIPTTQQDIMDTICLDLVTKISDTVAIHRRARFNFNQVIRDLKEIHEWYYEEINTPDVCEDDPTQFPTLFEDNWVPMFTLETGDGVNPMKVKFCVRPYYSKYDNEDEE